MLTARIAAFEIRYQLKNPVFWVSAVIFLLIGFDPANRCCPDDRYIRLGSGLDAAEAAPIKGIARGMGAESMDVTVAIQSQAQ